MASNQPAYAPARPESEPAREWDEFPAGETAAPDPHRLPQPLPLPLPAAVPVPRQRTLARGSAVLGMAAMAAVGASGVATAAAAPGVATGPAPVPVSAPDLPPGAPGGTSPSALPGLTELPAAVPVEAARPAVDETRGRTAPVPDPGEALRARIVTQATQAREAVARAEREAAERAAATQAARAAAAQKVREQAAATKAAAEAQAKTEAEAAARAEADRVAQLAASYIKPIASYTLTAGYGEADLWGNSPRRPGLRRPHRHPCPCRPRRHGHLGRLGGRLRLPGRGRAR
ncbi:hypothetical protein GA0115240_144863 [Streptomyces sp. DvalAA-14]|nr:hypothetical protein GA0115240_144863 [Streptomyces sp. DvalAA-14]